jgi:26S proteasome regulatory subunit N9
VRFRSLSPAKRGLIVVDPQAHLSFLTSLLSRIDTDKSKDAHVLLLATIARAKLLYGDLEGTRGEMEKAWGVLDALNDVEPGVNAAYYGLAADYYKVSVHICLSWFGLFRTDWWLQAKAEYAPYYKNSLLYLACVDTEKDMSPEERLLRAHDLGVSALLGDTIYNFGELVRHLLHVVKISDRM